RNWITYRLGGTASRFGHGIAPPDAIVQDVQKLSGGCHNVAIGGRNAVPPVPCGVSCRKIEHRNKPDFAVGSVIVEGLAGPLVRGEHSTSGITDMLGPMGFALALARDQAQPLVLRGDAVAEPINTRR